MIRRIQARDYRCLRDVDVRLSRFQVLTGANGTGKSTLFDALSFLGDLVHHGVEEAVGGRTRNFQDLVFRRPAEDLAFRLAVETDLPPGLSADSLCPGLPEGRSWRFRHGVTIAEGNRGVEIVHETSLLVSAGDLSLRKAPNPIVRRGTPEFPLSVAVGGTTRSTLAARPNGPDRFPAREALRQALGEGVRSIRLEPDRLREPSRPTLDGSGIAADGSTLAWAVQELQKEHPDDYEEWMRHVRTTLPELRSVGVNEREDERTAYLMLEYADGLRIPSWSASEGTLRFLLLTLLAYLPSSHLYLIEEPENGLHPFALDGVHDALSFPGDSQVIAATHSMEFLGLCDAEDILCFGRDAAGGTRIIRGPDHPVLKGSGDDPDVRLLFTAGAFP